MPILRILSLFLVFTAMSPDNSPGRIAKSSQSLYVFHPGDAVIAWDCRRIKKGGTPETLFGDRWMDVLRSTAFDRRHLTAGISIRSPATSMKHRRVFPASRDLPQTRPGREIHPGGSIRTVPRCLREWRDGILISDRLG